MFEVLAGLLSVGAILYTLGVGRQRVAETGLDPRRGPETVGGPPADCVCPHCGARFSQTMKFCGECGKAMRGEAT